MKLNDGFVKVEKQKQAIVAKVRKIQKVGSTYYVALPREFIKKYNFKPSDQVGVISDSIVKIIPMKEI